MILRLGKFCMGRLAHSVQMNGRETEHRRYHMDPKTVPDETLWSESERALVKI